MMLAAAVGQAGAARAIGSIGRFASTLTADDRRVLDILREAVAEALERKRRLGHYAVIWRDGQVVRLEPHEIPEPKASEPREE